MKSKEYKMFNGRLNRWKIAIEDAHVASVKLDACELIDALDNLDRKAELLIRSAITSECFQNVRKATLETRIACIKKFTEHKS